MIIPIIKKYLNKALLPTIIITMIFFLNFYFFGLSNTIIGPFATLSFLRFKNMSDHYSCMIRTLVIYLIMSILAYFAMMHFVLCIIMNAAALFWISYYLIDEYNPNNYFPAGMSLIFFQIFPAKNVSELLTRGLALLTSFLIIFIFLVFLFRRKKEDPVKQLVRDGILIAKEIIQLLEASTLEKELLSEKQNSLCEINQKISIEIYMANRASLRKEVGVNRYCSYIAFFQITNFTASEFIRYEKENVSENPESLLYNLEVVKNMYNNFQAALDTDIALTDTQKLNFRDLKMDIRSFRLRFALRMVITVTPCLLFSYLSFYSNSYWLAISVFFMMIPIYENTFKRVADRTKGTIAGILLCLILFTIFKDFTSRIIIMCIANFCIYCANSYAVTVTYITCSALALNDLSASTFPMLGQRLLYTIIAAIITLLVNHFLFPIRSEHSISYIKELLDNMRKRISTLQALQRKEKNRQLNRLIVKSYLLSSRLDVFSENLKTRNHETDIQEYQKMHMLYIANWLMNK